MSYLRIDTYNGATHTLFDMEDAYGLHPSTAEDVQTYLTLDQSKCGTMLETVYAWMKMFEKMKEEYITEEEYKNWEAKYPSND